MTLEDREAQTKAALPPDNRAESSKSAAEDSEPPPPYSEGSSPLDSFAYVMAAAGGPTSIITQVSQGGPAPVNTLSGMQSMVHYKDKVADFGMQMLVQMSILRWTSGMRS